MRSTLRFFALATGLALSACTGTETATSSPTPDAPPESAAGEQEVSTWATGSTISSGMPGVRDIEVLELRNNGAGPACGTGREAKLAYKAMKADGSVLDPGRRPFSFQVGGGQAIKAWDLIVAEMRVGDSFRVSVPQELAYGAAQGDLMFDMELLSVK